MALRQFPYMFDVVELFVTFSETGFPYYEFEVSPYNQTFQVRIVSHTQHQEGVDLGSGVGRDNHAGAAGPRN